VVFAPGDPPAGQTGGAESNAPPGNLKSSAASTSGASTSIDTNPLSLLKTLLDSPELPFELAILRVRLNQDDLNKLQLDSTHAIVGTLAKSTQAQIDRLHENRKSVLSKLAAAKPKLGPKIGKIFAKIAAIVLAAVTITAAVTATVATGGLGLPALVGAIALVTALSTTVGLASDISSAAGGPTFSVFSQVGGPPGLSGLLDSLLAFDFGGMTANAMMLAGEQDQNLIMGLSIAVGIMGTVLMAALTAKATSLNTEVDAAGDMVQGSQHFGNQMAALSDDIPTGALVAVNATGNTTSHASQAVSAKMLADAKKFEAQGVTLEAYRAQTQAFLMAAIEAGNDMLAMDQMVNRMLAEIVESLGSSSRALAGASPARA
jgi:hypothetical protein